MPAVACTASWSAVSGAGAAGAAVGHRHRSPSATNPTAWSRTRSCAAAPDDAPPPRTSARLSDFALDGSRHARTSTRSTASPAPTRRTSGCSRSPTGDLHGGARRVRGGSPRFPARAGSSSLVLRSDPPLPGSPSTQPAAAVESHPVLRLARHRPDASAGDPCARCSPCCVDRRLTSRWCSFRAGCARPTARARPRAAPVHTGGTRRGRGGGRAAERAAAAAGRGGAADDRSAAPRTAAPGRDHQVARPGRQRAAPGQPAGVFIEHDLDDERSGDEGSARGSGRLVPSRFRSAGTNPAGIAVGLLRNFITERHLEGTRG